MKRVHLICNAHLDPVWQWEWEEGVAAAISTFRSAADICEETDGFVFNHNEVILYEWIREYEPELFSRIQKLVKAGKWHISGGWYLQPDCNMPSGESFVRQMLLGRLYFDHYFGVRPTTALNYDSFGHSRGLVQIMKKSGFDSYIFMRPSIREGLQMEDNDFIWEGYDGSTVAARRMSGGYNTLLGKARQKLEDHIEFLKTQQTRDAEVFLWGVGNHGGGPSRKDIADLNALKSESDIEFIHSTLEEYFADVAQTGDRPIFRDSLKKISVGCYTSVTRIKQKHRKLENELYLTEKMCSAAATQGLMEYPATEIHEAMTDLAFAQFHDILPGSSVQPVEDMAVRLMDHGLENLSRVKARAFFMLAGGQHKAKEGEYPICVYNPFPYPVKTTVECEFMLADQNWADEFSMPRIYLDGKRLPAQAEKELSSMNLDWRKRVVFETVLQPSCMNRFECMIETLPAKPKPQLKAENGVFRFETALLKVHINANTGLMDKYEVDGVDYLAKDGFQPLCMMDNEDAWGNFANAIPVRGFREIEGKFTLMSNKDGARFSGSHDSTLPSVRVIEEGEVRTVIEAVLEYDASKIVLTYKLPKDGTEVQVDARVFWEQKDRMLKLSVPTLLSDAQYYGETAYGAEILENNGEEVVSQKWCAALSGEKAVTICNGSTYGSSCENGEVRLTLLRSAAFTSHMILPERELVPQDRFLARMDQGERMFTFWLNAGGKKERLAEVGREALLHNETPPALSFFPHGGGKAPQSLALLEGEAVELTAFKKAEKSDGYILRLFEPTGQARKVKIQLRTLNITQEVSLGAFEIKSYLAQEGKLTETNLMEEML